MLSDTAHKIGTEESWNERIAAVRENGIASIAAIVLERWFTAGYRRPDNADFVGYRTMLLRTPVDRLCRHLRGAARCRPHRIDAGARRADAGDGGRGRRLDAARAGAATAALIRGADFRIVPNAAHIACIEQPDAVAELIAAFAGGSAR